ncbi:microrchidia 6-like protein isoform X1 [Tanacetum coccineum]
MSDVSRWRSWIFGMTSTSLDNMDVFVVCPHRFTIRSTLSQQILIPYNHKFETVSSHGTRVVIYNLWQDEDGNMELDFESDPEDICITWDGKGTQKEGPRKAASEQHIVNRIRYSLRVIAVSTTVAISVDAMGVSQVHSLGDPMPNVGTPSLLVDGVGAHTMAPSGDRIPDTGRITEEDRDTGEVPWGYGDNRDHEWCMASSAMSSRPVRAISGWYHDKGYVLAEVVNFGNLDTKEVICAVAKGDITGMVGQFQDKFGNVCEGKTQLGLIDNFLIRMLWSRFWGGAEIVAATPGGYLIIYNMETQDEVSIVGLYNNKNVLKIVEFYLVLYMVIVY